MGSSTGSPIEHGCQPVVSVARMGGPDGSPTQRCGQHVVSVAGIGSHHEAHVSLIPDTALWPEVASVAGIGREPRSIQTAKTSHPDAVTSSSIKRAPWQCTPVAMARGVGSLVMWGPVGTMGLRQCTQ